ncbi:hypothetical protein Droror1_Dr00020183 [Drosera rotundifolia]
MYQFPSSHKFLSRFVASLSRDTGEVEAGMILVEKIRFINRQCDLRRKKVNKIPPTMASGSNWKKRRFFRWTHATQQTLEGKIPDLGKLGVRQRVNWRLGRLGSGLVSFGKGEREFGNVPSRYDLCQLIRSVREGW